MKNPFSRANATTALVQRKNLNDRLYGAEAAINVETIWTGTGTRYCDPLIRDHVINKQLAIHRERVASEDPLGILVTRMFSLLGWARAPKFYESDEQGAPEIMQDIRQLFQLLKLNDICAEVTFETLKHGWAGSYVWFDADENGQPSLMSEIYSAKQINQQDIVRDDLNKPVAWMVRGQYPLVPAGYTVSSMKTVHRVFRPGQPGWIVHTRGDYNKTCGLGYSRLVDLWDPITKLRVTSHSDAKRNEIFPLVVYPSSWEETDVQALFMSLAHVDENAGLAVKSGTDTEGNPVVGLPTIAWRSPAEDAPNVSGEGGPRGLPSELVRFCALSGITIKELAGDPGGAQEAGQTDFAQALEKNIQEWNYSSRPFLEKLLRMLEKMGIMQALGITLPPSFTIKGHWEWERDEMMMQQQQVLDSQLDNDTRDSESKERESKQKPKQNVAVEWHDTIPEQLFAAAMELCARENVPPGVMTPTTSSWVQSYGYDQDAFYLQFHDKGQPSHKIFRYPYVDDPEQMAREIETSGSPGGFVHRHPDLGVPRRTPYETISSLPQSMSWFGGSQPLTEYTGAEQGAEKLGQFGTKVPAREPNVEGYPQQTAAQGEIMTGPMRGPGAVDLSGIKALLQSKAKSFQQPNFAAMSGTKPAAVGPAAPASPFGQALGTQTLTQPAPLGEPIVPEHPLMVEHGHAGHAVQGRKRDAVKKGGEFAGVNWTGAYPSSTTPYSYNSAPIPIKRVNASVADLSVDQWQQLSKELNGGRGFNNETIEKVRRIMAGYHGVVERVNHLSVGNSMSFKDHPYLYEDDDGTMIVEYPCQKDWKTNVVGKTKKLKINAADTSKHGDVVIGTITYGWDDKTDSPRDTREYDRQNVMHLIEAAGGTAGEVYKRLKSSKEPDISTEYQCEITRHNNRRYQTKFIAGDSCLVDTGNCPSGECPFEPIEKGGD